MRKGEKSFFADFEGKLGIILAIIKPHFGLALVERLKKE